jgi:SAM-dependent methyltransferase
MPVKNTDVIQHNQEIHENRISWNRKKSLREAYAALYRRISDALCNPVSGHIVELGSGMGNIKSFIPDCITTDLFPNEWIDQTENVYKLSFDSNSLSNLILFDVWHHIEYPADALSEFQRVLCPEGRVIIMEPSMSIIGRVVYGLFHHEPLGFNHKFSEKISGLDVSSKTRYFAAQSSAYRLFKKCEIPPLLANWNILTNEEIVSFLYLASGGFRGPQLYPESFISAIQGLDSLLSFIPELFASRNLIVLEKKYEIVH